MDDGNKARDRAFAWTVSVVAAVFALLASELFLGWYEERIATSSEMATGLLRYHEQLGWTLTPNWLGRHRHHDFDVVYSINAKGFRGDFRAINQARQRVAVLGDSFTFGLGVDDGETFVSLLNQLDAGRAFLNFGVPGYSTDQELLMLQSQVLPQRPNMVWLAFYLGNDILDNALDYPLQADQAKPLFELRDDGSLVLRNVPVPREPKPALARERSIEDIAFGDALADQRTIPDRLRASSRLLGRLLPDESDTDDEALDAVLASRLGPQERLLSALLAEMEGRLHAEGIQMVLIPLPGASLVERPGSAAAVFQRYVLRFVVSEAKRLGIAQMNPIEALRSGCASTRCFHPNEGHYTAAAHGIIARFLWSQKTERAEPGRPL